MRLTIASLAVAVAAIGFGTYGGATIVQQGRDLGTTIKDQAGTVSSWLSERGIDVPSLSPQGGGKDGSHRREPAGGRSRRARQRPAQGQQLDRVDAGSVLGRRRP